MSDIREDIHQMVWGLNKDDVGPAVIAHLAERGMVVLGPDGEPLDVRPALRALGNLAAEYAEEETNPGNLSDEDLCREYLEGEEVVGPLVDACLAAAEVEP